MFLPVTATKMKLKLFQKQLQNVNHHLLLILLPFFGALLHMVGFVLFTFQVSLLQKLSISLPRILTWELMIFLAMLQIDVSFKIHSSLKTVMFQTNCNLNWLNRGMTQFCTAAATRKLSFMFLLQHLTSYDGAICIVNRLQARWQMVVQLLPPVRDFFLLQSIQGWF